jgi:hypothetical protein
MDCVLVSSAVDHVYYIIKNNTSDVMDCVLVSSAVDHVYYIIKNNISDVMDFLNNVVHMIYSTGHKNTIHYITDVVLNNVVHMIYSTGH